MCKRLLTLCFLTALSVSSSALLAGVAQAGPPVICGNNIEEPPETCDDGNTVGGDGCGPDCRDEVCGNGGAPQSTTTPPEECDDGNNVDDDNCTFPDCQFDCGDGEIDATTTPPETCEDGNSTNGDNCDDDTANGGNCTATGCGNGVVTAPEECDDGNTIDDQTCNADCTDPTVPLTKKQQACVNGVNANFAGVLKTRNADNNTCYKAVAGGKSTDFLACFGDDLKGKVAKAQTKTTNTVGKKCNDPEEVPGFAFTDAATVNTSANTASNDAFLFVFGAAPVIVVKSVDKAAAGCQAAAVTLLNKHTDTIAKEANKAKKKAIKGSKTTPAVGGSTALGDAIDAALVGNGKILASAGKISSTLGKKCTDGIIDANFDCAGAATSVATLATCIQGTALASACGALETADGIDLDCGI